MMMVFIIITDTDGVIINLSTHTSAAGYCWNPRLVSFCNTLCSPEYLRYLQNNVLLLLMSRKKSIPMANETQ